MGVSKDAAVRHSQSGLAGAGSRLMPVSFVLSGEEDAPCSGKTSPDQRLQMSESRVFAETGYWTVRGFTVMRSVIASLKLR